MVVFAAAVVVVVSARRLHNNIIGADCSPRPARGAKYLAIVGVAEAEPPARLESRRVLRGRKWQQNQQKTSTQMATTNLFPICGPFHLQRPPPPPPPWPPPDRKTNQASEPIGFDQNSISKLWPGPNHYHSRAPRRRLLSVPLSHSHTSWPFACRRLKITNKSVSTFGCCWPERGGELDTIHGCGRAGRQAGKHHPSFISIRGGRCRLAASAPSGPLATLRPGSG